MGAHLLCQGARYCPSADVPAHMPIENIIPDTQPIQRRWHLIAAMVAMNQQRRIYRTVHDVYRRRIT